MKALNNVEKRVLQMMEEGQNLRGWARDVLIEMQMREEEEAQAK